ncbi:MAG: hypothetical protein CM15mP92_2730 [Halieaceae bacterium]|nr:MAG: hypothetical protein CM15mP92_2730 [Halieaceae bacterium]
MVTAEALEIAAPGFFKQMSSVGLTAAFDAGMIDTMELGRRLALKMAEAGELPVRMVASLTLISPNNYPKPLMSWRY